MVMLSAGKCNYTKFTVIFSLAFLIGIALTVDFFWASLWSSSSSYSPSLSIETFPSPEMILKNRRLAWYQFRLDTMPYQYRVKTTFWDGWLYFTSGQRDRGPDNPQPKKVMGEM